MNWSITPAWNAAVSRNLKPLTPRDYIYASELGGATIDTVLKMKAVPFTNPPNDRSRRKFFAGNIFEDILYLAVLRCGVVIETQTHCRHQYDGLLMVSGRCDFIVGGKIERDKSIENIKSMNLSEQMEEVSINVVNTLADTYGDVQLDKYILECKSVSDFMFSKIEAGGPLNHHVMQAFHYQKSIGLPARIIYINKDDCRTMEFDLPDNSENLYRNEIEKITKAYHSEAEPEHELIFEGKISKNWRVEYSNYLTYLYRYETPFEYTEKWDKKIARWNRVLTRIKSGSKMTDDNKQALEEVKEYFPDIDKLISKIKDEDLN